MRHDRLGSLTFGLGGREGNLFRIEGEYEACATQDTVARVSRSPSMQPRCRWGEQSGRSYLLWQDAWSAESRFAWIVQFARAIRNAPFAPSAGTARVLKIRSRG